MEKEIKYSYTEGIQKPIYYNDIIIIIIIVIIAVPWRKRLDAHLPLLGLRVRVSVTPYGFRGGRKGV